MAGRNKQVYKITYPNGKIYVGMDLTGSISYFGSPSAKERISADLAAHRLDLTARKQILWESDTATDAEVRAMEVKLIREHRSNDPAVGYNLTPRFQAAVDDAIVPPMRWYALPENNAIQLSAPRLASWNKADDPAQVRLRAYLDDTEALLAASRIDGSWALRLDVGLPTGRDLLDMADLDNYAYPLAHRLQDSGLVSVWCTKQHRKDSYVRIEAAREVPPPTTDVLVAQTTASASTVAYKEQIYDAVAGAAELPPGPVRLELAFVVGPHRNWLNLWKQTIDSLDPLLGQTYPDRPWHPRDGRITELGMHVAVDPTARNDVVIGIAAASA
jgi:hypothetical protein